MTRTLALAPGVSRRRGGLDVSRRRGGLDASRRRGERGVSMTVFTAVVMVVLLIVIGLVVDGGAHSAAQRRAETIASSAARAGVDAGAGDQLAGVGGKEPAVQAAERVVAASGMTGVVSIDNDRIRVTVSGQVDTNFLSLIGINQLAVRAESTAVLRETQR